MYSKEEVERWERENQKKREQREYYKERDNRINEHLAKIEKHLEILSKNFQYFNEVRNQEIERQERVEQGLNGLEFLMRKIHNERIIQETDNRYDLEYVGNKEYSMFCAWCNAFKAIKKNDGTIDMERMKKEAYINDKLFREYCNNETISSKHIPSDTIKRYIAEKYFGYEYYKDDNGNLRVRKTTEGD